MPESQRLDARSPAESADRDSRAEALLVEGLDKYFSGDYEHAIHLWTRVLFLDRAHARARAYIDRARTAMSEGHRRTEEMLHTAGELTDRGDTVAARDLLRQIIAAGGDDERAAALRWRLERVEQASPGEKSASPPPAVVDVVPVPAPSRRLRVGLVVAGGLAIALLAITIVRGPTAQDWLGGPPIERGLPAGTAITPAVVLSMSDTALIRARTLYGRGRLAEALQALERVDPDSNGRQVADDLRARIQRELLEAVHPGAASVASSLRTATP